MTDYVVPHFTGIAQLIVLTHVDQVCPEAEEDVKYTYSSRTVQDKVLIEMTLISTSQFLYSVKKKSIHSNSHA